MKEISSLTHVCVFFVDLVCLYPLSAWLLRGLTGRSVGDRCIGVVWSRTVTGERPGILLCVANDFVTLFLMPFRFHSYADSAVGVTLHRFA